jgi:hypothetical protein
VDTNWRDGANWSLGTPPTAAQTALFTNNATVRDFTATVDAGFTSAVGGLVIDSTWGGTITVNSALVVNGNFTLASGSFGGSGAVTIAGNAMQWTGGQIDVGSGGLTNTGTARGQRPAGAPPTETAVSAVAAPGLTRLARPVQGAVSNRR